MSLISLRCPRCPEKFPVSEEDPDATLTGLWHHLREHTAEPSTQRALFAEAQQCAEQETGQ